MRDFIFTLNARRKMLRYRVLEFIGSGGGNRAQKRDTGQSLTRSHDKIVTVFPSATSPILSLIPDISSPMCKRSLLIHERLL